MSWYLILNKDGLVVSEASVESLPLPDGYRVITLDHRPDPRVERWDVATQSLAPVVALPLLKPVQSSPTKDPNCSALYAQWRQAQITLDEGVRRAESSDEIALASGLADRAWRVYWDAVAAAARNFVASEG